MAILKLFQNLFLSWIWLRIMEETSTLSNSRDFPSLLDPSTILLKLVNLNNHYLEVVNQEWSELEVMDLHSLNHYLQFLLQFQEFHHQFPLLQYLHLFLLPTSLRDMIILGDILRT